MDERRVQISTTGGTRPVWSRSRTTPELFYLDEEGYLTVVEVRTAPAFYAGKPVRLLNRRYFSLPGPRTFDVSNDGRFLMVKDKEESEAPPGMVVVLNWSEELKARVR